MKKFVTLLLCFMLLFTSSSYAQPNIISDTLNDMQTVDRRINIIIKSIIGDDPINVEEVEKEVRYVESILGQRSRQLENVRTSETNLQTRRSYTSLLYGITSYELTLDSILLYVNNQNQSDYFIEACSAYQHGSYVLNNISSRNP